jgi:nucleoside-diphosphate-sugar epimerase
MILVTGGTGAMGSVLVRMLAGGRGEEIRVLCAPGDPNVPKVHGLTSEVRFADITDGRACDGVCDGATTVLHLAAAIISKDESIFRKVNFEGTRNIAEAAKRAGVRQFVYVSSASVTYPVPTPYSLSKLAAEETVKQSGIPYTILRPTLVYGERGGQEFDMYLDYLRKFPAVPFIGNGKALKRPVFVEDVNAGIISSCGNEKALNKTYNLSGGEAVSMIDFTRLCLRLLGSAGKPVVHLPVWLCKAIAAMMRATMSDPPLKWQVIAGIIQDANLDPSDATADLGYAPKKVSEWLPKVFPRKKYR